MTLGELLFFHSTLKGQRNGVILFVNNGGGGDGGSSSNRVDALRTQSQSDQGEQHQFPSDRS